MLVESLAISLLVGLLLKGRISNLAEMELKHVWIPFCAFGFEAVLGRMLGSGSALFIEHQVFLTFVVEGIVYAGLFIFLYKNRHLKGMKLLALGTALNFIAIFMNGGAMPVDPALGLRHGFEVSLAMLEQGRIFAHQLMTESTRVPLLGDWIMIPPPWPWPKTISPGDVFIDLGVFWLVIQSMSSGHARNIQL